MCLKVGQAASVDFPASASSRALQGGTGRDLGCTALGFGV